MKLNLSTVPLHFATAFVQQFSSKNMKKILLDAFETPYGAANLQIELNIITIKNNETICAYNNRVEEIY